jgi:hypothetical protein
MNQRSRYRDNAQRIDSAKTYRDDVQESVHGYGAAREQLAGAMKSERPSNELLCKSFYLQSVFFKRDLMWGGNDQMVGIGPALVVLAARGVTVASLDMSGLKKERRGIRNIKDPPRPTVPPQDQSNSWITRRKPDSLKKIIRSRHDSLMVRTKRSAFALMVHHQTQSTWTIRLSTHHQP